MTHPMPPCGTMRIGTNASRVRPGGRAAGPDLFGSEGDRPAVDLRVVPVGGDGERPGRDQDQRAAGEAVRAEGAGIAGPVRAGAVPGLDRRRRLAARPGWRCPTDPP